MSHRSPRKAVLVASRDPNMADVRKRVLEDAGFRVVAATTVEQVQKACQEKPIALVLVGHSVPPSDKRRFFTEARKHCKTPVLELFQTGTPELVEESRTFSHQSHTPDDFLKAVLAIIAGK
jgi:DNA-binding response OmpR family regulator